VSTLLESEWSQGTVVPHDLLPFGTLPTSVPTDAKLIVLSHDCDLVNLSYEAEPFVELFVARPRAAENRDDLLFNGKNPRKLQFFGPTEKHASMKLMFTRNTVLTAEFSRKAA